MRRFKKLPTVPLPTPVPAATGLILAENVSHSRRPYGSAHLTRAVPGRVVTRGGVFSQVMEADEQGLGDGLYEGLDGEEARGDLAEGALSSEDEGSESESEETVLRRTVRAAKKEKQWRTWSEKVIPALLKPYVTLLRETNSFKTLHSARGHTGCLGCKVGHRLEVSCIFFESECLIQ